MKTALNFTAYMAAIIAEEQGLEFNPVPLYELFSTFPVQLEETYYSMNKGRTSKTLETYLKMNKVHHTLARILSDTIIIVHKEKGFTKCIIAHQGKVFPTIYLTLPDQPNEEWYPSQALTLVDLKNIQRICVAYRRASLISVHNDAAESERFLTWGLGEILHQAYQHENNLKFMSPDSRNTEM